MSTEDQKSKKLVDINDVVKSKNPLVRVMKKPASLFLGLDRINKGYAKACETYGREQLEKDFFRYMTAQFGLDYEVKDTRLKEIPKQGACVVLANHPYGLADGLVFGKILTDVRSDVKIIANEALNLCEEIRPWLISVDPFDTREARRKNVTAMKQILEHLRNGGMLGVFPAGSASSFSMRDRCVIDDPWNKNIAAIIRKAQATVVALHFFGRNSLLFQGVSLLKKEARVALLPRELKRSVNKKLKVNVSSPIPFSKLRKFDTDEDLIEHLRLLTYCIGRRAMTRKKLAKMKHQPEQEEIIPQRDTKVYRQEVKDLPKNSMLLKSGKYEVYIATSMQIPELLLEIGRLREITFREVGEGTGKSYDLDSFDVYYKHLFLWDAEEECLVGAYRLGETDVIIEERGVKGLYNSNFFKFKKGLFEVINPGLELGRSFIVKKYQRKPTILGLIWQGVGQFVARNPHYRYLFGVVSTSAEFDQFSFNLIVDFLKLHALDEELSKLIKPKNPIKGKALRPTEIQALIRQNANEQDLSELVSRLEEDGKGIPVLLRQYLKLNGKILSFNIDDDFGGVLDCMILVDLHHSPRRSLTKYMGKATAEKMLGPESVDDE